MAEAFFLFSQQSALVSGFGFRQLCYWEVRKEDGNSCYYRLVLDWGGWLWVSRTSGLWCATWWEWWLIFLKIENKKRHKGLRRELCQQKPCCTNMRAWAETSHPHQSWAETTLYVGALGVQLAELGTVTTRKSEKAGYVHNLSTAG